MMKLVNGRFFKMLVALYMFAPILLFYQSFGYDQGEEWPECDIEYEEYYFKSAEERNDHELGKDTNHPEIEVFYEEDNEAPVFYQFDDEKAIENSDPYKSTETSDSAKIITNINVYEELKRIVNKEKLSNEELSEIKRILDDEFIKHERLAHDGHNVSVSNDYSIENKILAITESKENTLFLEKELKEMENKTLSRKTLEENTIIEDASIKTLAEDKVAEIAEELEAIEEVERNIRASEFECEHYPPPMPYYPWYFDPWYGPVPVPYYVPYVIPVPVSVSNEALVETGATMPVTETVPVKGKVTIFGTFTDCNWNHPASFYPTADPYYFGPITNPVVYPEYNPAETAPFCGTVPVSGKVTIAAKFDDCSCGNMFPPQQFPIVTPPYSQVHVTPDYSELGVSPGLPGIDSVVPEVTVCGKVPACGEVTIAAKF